MHSCAAVQIMVNGISQIVNVLVRGQVAVKSCLILTVLRVGRISSTTTRRLSSVHSQSLPMIYHIQFPRTTSNLTNKQSQSTTYLSYPTHPRYPATVSRSPIFHISKSFRGMWRRKHQHSVMETILLLKMFRTQESKEAIRRMDQNWFEVLTSR